MSPRNHERYLMQLQNFRKNTVKNQDFQNTYLYSIGFLVCMHICSSDIAGILLRTFVPCNEITIVPIREVLIHIWNRESVPLDYEPGSCFLFKGFQDANKKFFFLSFYCLHLHQSSKITSYLEVKVILNFLLDYGRIRSRSRIQKLTDPEHCAPTDTAQKTRLPAENCKERFEAGPGTA
jgi:hypothetical protein